MDIFDFKVEDIDLEIAKQHLKVDYDDDDLLIQNSVYAAQSYLQTYLGYKFEDFDETPQEFTIACLGLIAFWYDQRSITSEKNAHQDLKHMFSGILDMHRNWNGGSD